MAWMLDTAYHGAGPSARLLALLAHLAALKAARLQGPLPDGVPRVSGRIEQATLQALGAGRRGTLSAGVQHDLRGCALFERIAVLLPASGVTAGQHQALLTASAGSSQERLCSA